MAAITEINFTAIASIISACAAATPPLLTAATNIALRVREVTQKHRSSALRVLSISRIPASYENWKRVKRNFLLGFFFLIALALFIATNTLLYRFNYGYFTLSKFGIVGTLFGFEINVIVLLNFLFFCSYSISFRNAYNRMGKKPHQARHFLFEKAILVVESDIKSTVDKCYETLRLLGARVIEFDPESAVIEAYTNNELVSAFGGLYRINLSKEISKSIYTNIEVKFISHLSDESTKLTSSSNTNRFIKTFVSG